jgi:glycosyltransferase involved in cell wall biosynthesis
MLQSPKKRIVIDARYLLRPGMGIHVYLESVLVMLLTKGYDITLLLDKEISSTKKYGNVKFVILPSRFKFYWEQILLPRYLKYADYDIYFAPSNNGLPLFYIKRGHIFILTVHDLIPFHFPLLYIRRPVFTLYYLLSTTISVFRADTIMADSQFTADDTMRIFHKQATPVYVPLSHVTNKIISKDETKEKKSKTFVFNGGADPRKNVDQAILGFQLFLKKRPEYKLIIMGNGYTKYEKLVYQRGINNIEFVGYVSERRKTQLISEAIALVYPSSMEGFGLPIIEAFSCSTLVITANNSSLSEVAEKGAIYLARISPVAIRDTMEQAVNLSYESEQTYIEEGRKRLQYFSQDKVKDRIVKTFEEASTQSKTTEL